MLLDQIAHLAAEKSQACVSISLNTHRTHPDNLQNAIVLKNLCKEAETRLLKEFDKKEIGPLFDRLQQIPERMDVNEHLDSLHVFLSNDTEEIVRSPFRTLEDQVQINEHFTVRPLIKAFTRTHSYLIVVLGQSGVNVYEAENDAIQHEIRNEDFPFGENQKHLSDKEKKSDGKKVDDLVREYLNRVDKGLVNVHNESGLNYVVVCTQDNYDRLLQVADKPSIYLGHIAIDYNNKANHKVAADAYSFIKLHMSHKRADMIEEVQNAVGAGKVITDLNEIYRAAMEGRGDLLLVHEEFAQPVLKTSDMDFTLVNDPTSPGVIDDIVSDIAWNVLLRKGRVVFTKQEGLQNFGNIALKVRY